MIKVGLTGWPVSQSKSPLLQNTAFAVCGIAGQYDLYPVDPGDPRELRNLIDKVREGQLDGLNVTIPHKQAVIPLLDSLSPSAQAIGAVNLIYRKDGQLIGHNTDAPGFLADVHAKLFPDQPEWAAGAQVLVLGAGGSARAVAWILSRAGARVILAARRITQSESLARELSNTQDSILITGISMSCADLSSVAGQTKLLVNTTPVGMIPKVEVSPWPVELDYPEAACVYDLIYNPRQTLFVRSARDAGLRAVSGIGMLVEQAALGFEIWTGRAAPRREMAEAVEEK